MNLFNCYFWIFAIIFSVYSSPITNFNDDWKYEIISNDVPIVKEVKEHKLPPEATIQAKENSESLGLLGFNGNSLLENAIGQLGDSVRSKIPCSVCQLVVGLLQKDVLNGETLGVIKEKFVAICVSFEIQNEVVCTGIFDVFGPEVASVLNETKIGPKEICRMCFGEVCANVEIPDHEWAIDLPNVKKPALMEFAETKRGNPTLKVLHISDTHFDPDYVQGTTSNCQEPLCCRTNSTPKKNTTVVPAGMWGAYEYCDAPKVLIENMLKNIAKQHPDIDYIIWTGDLPPHDIWQQTKDGSLDILKECVLQMQTAFPNTPIFPALGNHEGIPAGNFPPPWISLKEHSISWLYEEVNKQWKIWLPDTEESSILHGGFYSVLVRPGLRLISLNMNYCHSLSWWLFVNSTDPAHELKWLVHQLQQAENNREKVHVIGHIPPGGTDCLKTWSENYYRIVNRYENTIAAQFFGHTHADEFAVFYDDEKFTRPVSIAYMGPSVTPYSGQNPAYRIYYVDSGYKGSSGEVLDHETWTMDLEKANKEGEQDPLWFKLYSAKESYGMPNLKPKEWNHLIYRMVQDSNLFHQFYRFYFRNSPVMPKYGDKEKLQILCDLKCGKSQDRRHLCHDLELMIHG